MAMHGGWNTIMNSLCLLLGIDPSLMQKQDLNVELKNGFFSMEMNITECKFFY